MWESLSIVSLFWGYFCVRTFCWGLSVWSDVHKRCWNSVFQGLFVPPLSWLNVRRDAPVCCMYIVALKSCCPEFDPVRQQWTWTVITLAWCGVTWTAEWPLLPLYIYNLNVSCIMLVYYFVPFIVSDRYLLFWVSNGHNSVTVQNQTHVYMNFFITKT